MNPITKRRINHILFALWILISSITIPLIALGLVYYFDEPAYRAISVLFFVLALYIFKPWFVFSSTGWELFTSIFSTIKIMIESRNIWVK